ncbi:HvfC/BufC family peptide modification chaperone, partial [Kaarinaea lacus]
MFSLKQLQDAFTGHLMADNAAIKEHVTGSSKVPGELRLDIYRNAYRERLIETLAGDYEVLAKLIGEEAFRRVSKTYIDRHPSEHYSLRWFGKDLAGFLDYSADDGSHGWEAEMARFEWTFINSFDAADIDTVNEQDAATIPPDQWPVLSASFHPSVNVVPLWW